MRKLLFLVLFMVACGNYEEGFDFVTDHGIRVSLSPLMESLTPEKVEGWTIELVTFWNETMDWHEDDLFYEISKSYIYMADVPYFTLRSGMKVNGVMHWLPSKYIVEIATLCKPEVKDCDIIGRVKSLFMHEESHAIVGALHNIPYGNESHHKFFAEVGLGY